MTTLNTQDFKDAYNALDKAKYPNNHTPSSGYVALATMLEICINWKMGITQIQKRLDEKTSEWETELHNFLFERYGQ
jgi:hypothetical protein